ncbi:MULTISPECIES: sensor histidine kinase [unclassified Luteimonas]|uniref:sensor histidine kinase n=1 Tax=unclassified Luteimonas TaxID=2629088 RepID=UPI0018F0FB43|nr:MULTISPECIES: sensor histidine kinase [unclassified Luteimonas]MBJ6978356.1 sensor histidine kinase [Luteimonas sp. MC1895]MBJ6983862.1 sensor histidine kinase [Luteimonas sp. MC1750]QQO06682.1 sensor histidine kinase [Luteimonas sp. MC1750]
MHSGLADFIEGHRARIVDEAILFARTIEVGSPLDDVELRDHLPQILSTIVEDLRTRQTPAEEIAKAEGRCPSDVSDERSPAATHALHRARSGFSISDLVAEYRAMRAAVLRAWAQSPEAIGAAPADITRFNEAIDEAVAVSVKYYAEEVDRWRAIFLGVLGHDLRTPLTAIMLTSEHLSRMAMDAPVAKAVQRLISSGERMSQLLDRLLVYNRARMGIGFDVQRTQVDLAQACREEIGVLLQSMPEARVEFRAPPALEGMFDAETIREALSNLVVNAWKYGRDGTGIGVELREAGEAGEAVEIVVSNYGEPIPRELLELMFEPLRRGAMASDELERGSLGLGLFIVSQIAKAHAGTVQADSEDGTTRFTLRLPRSPAA